MLGSFIIASIICTICAAALSASLAPLGALPSRALPSALKVLRWAQSDAGWDTRRQAGKARSATANHGTGAAPAAAAAPVCKKAWQLRATAGARAEAKYLVCMVSSFVADVGLR